MSRHPRVRVCFFTGTAGLFLWAMHQSFKRAFDLAKSVREEDGFAHIEGVASGTEVDLTGERMSARALRSMVESLTKGLVELRSGHSHDPDASIGEIRSLWINEDNKRAHKARLDLGFSKALDPVHALSKGHQPGVSIGGRVINAGYEFVQELGKSVFTHFDILPQEVFNTGTAAYPYS